MLLLPEIAWYGDELYTGAVAIAREQKLYTAFGSEVIKGVFPANDRISSKCFFSKRLHGTMTSLTHMINNNKLNLYSAL